MTFPSVVAYCVVDYKSELILATFKHWYEAFEHRRCCCRDLVCDVFDVLSDGYLGFSNSMYWEDKFYEVNGKAF